MRSSARRRYETTLAAVTAITASRQQILAAAAWVAGLGLLDLGKEEDTYGDSPHARPTRTVDPRPDYKQSSWGNALRDQDLLNPTSRGLKLFRRLFSVSHVLFLTLVVVVVVVVVVYLTLTDSLRIQPWSQDRQNHTKSNREKVREKSRQSRQKTTDKKVASTGHRRQEGIQKTQKIKINARETETQAKAQTEETNKRQPHNTLFSRLRKKGSLVSGGIQPGQEDKGKGNEYDTQRNNKHRRKKGRQQSNEINE